MKRYWGHHISEYILILSLLVLVTVSALATLGGDVSSMLTYGDATTRASDLYSLIDSDGEDSETRNSIRAGAPSSIDSVLSEGNALLEGASSSARSANTSQTNVAPDFLEDGSVTTSAEGFQDMATTIQQQGTARTARAQAEGLDQALKDLVKTTKLTPEQKRTIKDLSNQAHKMARIHEALEKAAARSSSPQEFNSKPILFEGQTYTPRELSLLIGWDGQNKPFDGTSPVNTPQAGAEMAAFQQLYRRAETSGSFEDPAIAAAITDHANQIGFLGEKVEHSVWLFGQEDKPAGSRSALSTPKTSSMKNYNAVIAAEATDVHAAGICTTGQSQSNGASCQ